MPATLQAEITAIFTGHADAIYDLCEGHVLPFFYSASGDHFVGRWNRLTGAYEQPLAKAVSSVYCMETIPVTPLLLIGTRSGLIHVVDVQQRKPLHSLQLHTKPVFDIQYLPGQGQFSAAGEDGLLTVWDATSFSLVHSYQLSNTALRCLALSPSGKLLAVGGSDNLIRLFSLPEMEQVAILQGHANSVFTAVFTDEDTLLTGSRDAHLFRWENSGGIWVTTAQIPAHNFTINHLALSPSGKWLASASRDKTVKIWETGTLQLRKVLQLEKVDNAHTHSVNRVLWLSDKEILSAGDDRRIIAWQITEQV
jgi:WD40 repeat protein